MATLHIWNPARRTQPEFRLLPSSFLESIYPISPSSEPYLYVQKPDALKQVTIAERREADDPSIPSTATHWWSIPFSRFLGTVMLSYERTAQLFVPRLNQSGVFCEGHTIYPEELQNITHCRSSNVSSPFLYLPASDPREPRDYLVHFFSNWNQPQAFVALGPGEEELFPELPHWNEPNKFQSGSNFLLIVPIERLPEAGDRYARFYYSYLRLYPRAKASRVKAVRKATQVKKYRAMTPQEFFGKNPGHYYYAYNFSPDIFFNFFAQASLGARCQLVETTYKFPQSFDSEPGFQLYGIQGAKSELTRVPRITYCFAGARLLEFLSPAQSCHFWEYPCAILRPPYSEELAEYLKANQLLIPLAKSDLENHRTAQIATDEHLIEIADVLSLLAFFCYELNASEDYRSWYGQHLELLPGIRIGRLAQLAFLPGLWPLWLNCSVTRVSAVQAAEALWMSYNRRSYATDSERAQVKPEAWRNLYAPIAGEPLSLLTLHSQQTQPVVLEQIQFKSPISVDLSYVTALDQVNTPTAGLRWFVMPFLNAGSRAKGLRTFLGDEKLKQLIADFWNAQKVDIDAEPRTLVQQLLAFAGTLVTDVEWLLGK